MNRNLAYLIVPLIFMISCTTDRSVQLPNVLIVLADDLGSTDLACYGAYAKTPNLDKLAEKGLKFTNFYAPAPNCSPSRTGLLTGRMPSRVGMYSYRAQNHAMHLPDSEVTIAEKLKGKGYQTAHFGKWHLSCLPQDKALNQPQPRDQGFEYSFGTENNAKPSHLNPVNFVRNDEVLGEMKGYSCQILVEEVKHWFKNHHKKEKPFFLYVAYHEVHKKIASPPEMKLHYQNVPENEAAYLANIENMDDATGRIINELENRDLIDNTLIIFASDNGPYKSGSAGDLRGLKGEVYDGGIRVPGIIFWKDKIQNPRTVEAPGGLIDVFPTLADICDFSLPQDRKIDGTSLFPVFNDRELERQTPLTWFFYRSFPEMSMRIDDYMLLGNALDSIPRTHPMADLDMDFIKNMELQSFELYNIKDDREQKNDLAKTHPEILERMKPQMLEVLEEIKSEGPYWEGLFEYENLPSKFKKGYIRH